MDKHHFFTSDQRSKFRHVAKDYSGGVFASYTFRECDFAHCNFAGTAFAQPTFSRCAFDHCNFSGSAFTAYVDTCTFIDCCFDGVVFFWIDPKMNYYDTVIKNSYGVDFRGVNPPLEHIYKIHCTSDLPDDSWFAGIPGANSSFGEPISFATKRQIDKTCINCANYRPFLRTCPHEWGELAHNRLCSVGKFEPIGG